MHRHTPFVKLPPKIDYILYLITQELKIRHYINNTHGREHSYSQTHLDRKIMRSIGLNEHDAETVQVYNFVMNKCAAKVNDSKDSVLIQSMRAFVELEWRAA